MDFALTPEQENLKRTARRFLARECPREVERRLDEEAKFPAELYARLAALGFTGLLVPTEYGGSGGTVLDAMILAEELAYGSNALAGAYTFLAVYGTTKILSTGSEEQKAALLPGIVEGKVKVAFALTEPEAGTGIGAVKTVAERHGDSYRISGAKIYINGADVAEYVITGCVTDRSAEQFRNLSLFVVPTSAAGFRARPLRKLGTRALSSCEVHLDDVEVAASAILGGEAQVNLGWRALRRTLDHERAVLAAVCLGGAQRAYEESLEYAKQRQQGGQPIGNYQAVMHRLVDMATKVHAARLLVYHTGWMLANKWPASAQASMAKVFTSEVCKEVCLDGMQIFGGTGYMMEHDMQRYLRDAMLGTIVGGTNETQRNLIGMELGLGLPK